MAQPAIPTREAVVDSKTGVARRPLVLWMQALQRLLFQGDQQGAFIRWGEGSPEGVVTGPVGSFYSRTNGGANTVFYVKESGTGATGWVAK